MVPLSPLVSIGPALVAPPVRRAMVHCLYALVLLWGKHRTTTLTRTHDALLQARSTQLQRPGGFTVVSGDCFLNEGEGEAQLQYARLAPGDGE